MPATGFDDPRLAARPPGGNLYYEADASVAAKLIEPDIGVEPRGLNPVHTAQVRDLNPGAPVHLIFGDAATTGSGEPIALAANSSKGHVSEILNFHGSPAPWILIGILLVAGLLHLEAGAKFGGGIG
jgi:hypothetical protein